MMIRPKGDQLEITFSVSEPESWDGFVHNLNTFLSRKTFVKFILLLIFIFISCLCNDKIKSSSTVMINSCLSLHLSAAYNDSYQAQTNDYCPPDQYFIQEDSGEVNRSHSLPV